MMRHAVFALVVIAVGACHRNGAPPTTPRDPLEAIVDRVGAEAVASGQTVGATIAIARHGKLVLAKGYGFSDIITQRHADPATVYRIGSVTKQFTAAAIMQLVEHGKVKLDDEVRTYVDVPTSGHVTIRQLLHHTSGMPSYTDVPEFDTWVARHVTPAALVGIIKDQPWDFDPGTKWNYSNTGYVVLGMVIEKVSGEPYAAYLANHVFPPAGLHTTSYCDESTPDPHRARGYTRKPDGKIVDAQPIDMSTPYAAGAVCSTAGDLLAWTAALAGGKVVSAASYAEMTRSHGIAGQQAYGFGLFVGDLEGHRSVWHGGGINGFISELHDYPDDGLTVVVLTNTESRAAPRIETAVVRSALGLPSTDVALGAVARQAFVGTYDTPGLGDVQILVEAGHLAVAAPDQPHFMLEFRGNDTFAIVELDAKLTFHRAAGKVTGMTIEQGGKRIQSTRVP